MYLRTITRRNKDGSSVRYCQLAHNNWDPERRQARAEVVYSLGREDQLDREALKRLVRSISRFLEPAEALEATAGTELSFLASRPYGGAYVLDCIWRRLEIPAAIAKATSGRRLSSSVERLLFALVANRALCPTSKLAALEWAVHDVALPDAVDFGADPQVFYRAMDFLLAADEVIQREVFFSVVNLLNLEVDVILFDTTSTYFETEDDDSFRRYGHSKDHRDDRPQVVVGLAVTKEGIPVRCWSFAGNAADTAVIRQVHDELGAWKLHRVLWVGDRGFASEQNRAYLQRSGGHFLFGEKLRQGDANHEALARPGRYQAIDEHLEVKEVIVGHGTTRRRFVVGKNPAEEVRDRERRARALERIETELAAIATRKGDARLAAEGELLAHPMLKRYLSRRSGKLVVDKAKVRAEERLDGKFLLSSSDDGLGASDMARLYKSLLEVEASWRDLKQVIELRPVYHRKGDRIRAHVTLCFLALMLVRVIERATGDTWNNVRRELERMHLGEFTGPVGHVVQRTETTPRQREILKALDVREPPLVHELDVTPRRRKRVKRPA
ncbi:MAG: IS1634 family transposase [Acidimicrobiales bacterium]